METNKIDTIVRDLLQSRTIQPSESSWERLSNQLDIVDQPKKSIGLNTQDMQQVYYS